jgi:hypothetical protein
MSLVVLSGVVGRFIYLRIPHTIEGREMSLQEVKDLKNELDKELREEFELGDVSGWVSWGKLKAGLRAKGLPKDAYLEAKKILRSELFLTRRIQNLERMQNLFKYWHVVHLPFALIMLVTLVIHVTVVLLFGYRWIF